MCKVSTIEWVGDIRQLQPGLDEHFFSWMVRPGNLGGALRAQCGGLKLSLISQGQDQPLPDEAAKLGMMPGAGGLIRQIMLFDAQDKPLTFGRVVMSDAVYQAHAVDMDTLGARLIGETLLYSNPTTVRSAFEFGRVLPVHSLGELLIQRGCRPSLSDGFPARRSVFHLNGVDPILITEIFLEGVPRVLSRVCTTGE